MWVPAPGGLIRRRACDSGFWAGAGGTLGARRSWPRFLGPSVGQKDSVWLWEGGRSGPCGPSDLQAWPWGRGHPGALGTQEAFDQNLDQELRPTAVEAKGQGTWDQGTE